MQTWLNFNFLYANSSLWLQSAPQNTGSKQAEGTRRTTYAKNQEF